MKKKTKLIGIFVILPVLLVVVFVLSLKFDGSGKQEPTTEKQSVDNHKTEKKQPKRSTEAANGRAQTRRNDDNNTTNPIFRSNCLAEKWDLS